MATTHKVEKPRKKVISHELTYFDVRKAARDGQKAFDEFQIVEPWLVGKLVYPDIDD